MRLNEPIIQVTRMNDNQMQGDLGVSQRQKAQVLRASRELKKMTPEEIAQSINAKYDVMNWPERTPHVLTGEDILAFEENKLVITNDLMGAYEEAQK